MEKELAGHVSEATAYAVSDYPWGFRLKTDRYVWLDFREGHGWRFAARTRDPRNGRLCAVKFSTYAKLAASMYLDEHNHVQWTGLSPYSMAEDVLSFVKRFPNADMRHVGPWALEQAVFTTGFLTGSVAFRINGKTRELSDLRREELKAEVAIWQEVASLLNFDASGLGKSVLERDARHA